LDNIYFSNNRLLDFAHDFDKMGGKYLFLDEVHKYGNWSQEMTNNLKTASCIGMHP